MRTILVLIATSLTAASPAVFAQISARHVRFASIQTNTVVNEVVASDRFYFEKCDFFHVDGVNALDELNEQKFVNCNSLGLAQPIEARERVLRQLDEDFLERRRELGDPNVLKWALNGALQGGLVGGLGSVVINRMFPRFIRQWTGFVDPVRIFTTFGGFSAIVVGWSSAHRAIKSQGKNRSTLDLLDPSLPSALYVLDQRTNDRRAQLRAMDQITDVITRTMSDFVP